MKRNILISLMWFSSIILSHAQTLFLPSGVGGIGTSSNGNVGIGTNSPTHRFQANDNSLNGVMIVKSGNISNDFTTTGVSYPRQFGLGVISGQSYTSDIQLTQTGWLGGYGGYIGSWFDVNAGNEGSTNLSGIVSVLRGTGSGNAYGFYSNLNNLSNGYTKYGIFNQGETYNYFSGKVGIGTLTPAHKLQSNDDSNNGVCVIKSGSISNDFTTNGVTYARQFGLGVIAGKNYSSDIQVTQPGWLGGYGGYIGGWFDSNAGDEGNTNISGVVSVLRGTGSGNAYGFYSNLTNLSGGYVKYGIYSQGETKNYLSGNLGIGTTNPGSYKLAVEGKIGAREVNVTIDAWSDFVFAPTYTLPTLEDLENYINTNKHLPDVPTEKEVKENGLNLGQNDAVLLQKVEELTLYVIEQNKKIKEQSTKIEEQDKASIEQNETLKAQFELLKEYKETLKAQSEMQKELMKTVESQQKEIEILKEKLKLDN